MYYLSNFLGALQRGRGCVTFVHCFLKPKAVTQNLRDNTSSNNSKNISTQTSPFTVTHPFIPSQEGKPPRYKPIITNKKQAPQTSLSKFLHLQ